MKLEKLETGLVTLENITHERGIEWRRGLRNFIAFASLRKSPKAEYKRANGSTWLTVLNSADSDTAEMVIEGSIGESWWDGSGTTSKQFRNALAAIPKNKNVTVRINSEGGSVGDALSIHNLIKERGNVDTRVDGYALSSASIIAIAGRKVQMPKSSIMMIHEPWAQASGDSEDFRKASEMLDVHGATMAKIYSDRSGKTAEECRAIMKEETWLDGDDAKEHGFADDVIESEEDDAQAKAALAALDLARFQNVPVAVLAMAKQISPAPSSQGPAGTAAGNDPQNANMNPPTTPAAVSPPANHPAAAATPPIAATPAPETTIPLAEFRALQAQLASERKSRIEARIDRLITSENRLSNDERADALTRALADESYLDVIAKRPTLFTAGSPLTGSHDIEVNGNFLDQLRDLRPATQVPHAIGGMAAISACERYQKRKNGWAQMVQQARAMDDRGMKPRAEHVSNPHVKFVRMGTTPDGQAYTMPIAASTYSTALIVDQLADGAITQLVNTFAPLRLFTRDFMPSPFSPLSNLQIRLVTQAAGALGNTNANKLGKGTGTETYGSTQAYETGDHTVSAVNVTMYEYFRSFFCTAQDLMSGLRIEQLANYAMLTLGTDVMQDTLALLNSSAFSAGPLGGTMYAHYGNFQWNSSGASDMATLRAQLGKSSIKNALIDPVLFSKLVTIPVVNAVPLGVPMANPNTFRNVFGWDEIAETTAWATGQGAGGSTYSYGSPIIGFGCNPQAIAVGCRLPILPPEGVPGNTITMAQVEIPGLDLTVAIFSWFSLNYRTLWNSFDIVYGALAGDLTAGCVIKSNGQ